jgi:hypothetical protein
MKRKKKKKKRKNILKIKKKNREPKKFTGRDGVLANSKLNKFLERKRKKKKVKEKKKFPGSGTMKFQSW